MAEIKEEVGEGRIHVTETRQPGRGGGERGGDAEPPVCKSYGRGKEV
jgi:hypothetical protein